MLMWCRRITERCAPAAAFLGCQAYRDIAHVPDGIASDDLRERWAHIVSGEFPASALEDSRTKIVDAAKLVEDQLADGRDWLMSDLSIADFETYGWLAGMVEIVPDAFADKPRLAEWLKRVASRPSVAKALALATVPDPRKAWAPGQEINRWG
jgi:GSH-dependent disulfide-bond oxidoreductase